MDALSALFSNIDNQYSTINNQGQQHISKQEHEAQLRAYQNALQSPGLGQGMMNALNQGQYQSQNASTWTQTPQWSKYEMLRVEEINLLTTNEGLRELKSAALDAQAKYDEYLALLRK